MNYTLKELTAAADKIAVDRYRKRCNVCGEDLYFSVEPIEDVKCKAERGPEADLGEELHDFTISTKKEIQEQFIKDSEQENDNGKNKNARQKRDSGRQKR